jgi:hypothetical protein
VGIMGSSPRTKRAEHEPNRWPLANVEVKKAWTFITIVIRLGDVVLNEAQE